MYLDVVHLRAFYDLPLGRLLRSLIGAPIRKMWPDLTGQALLGIGYAGPFMRPYLDTVDRAIAAMPAPQGAVHWPRERKAPVRWWKTRTCRFPMPISTG